VTNSGVYSPDQAVKPIIKTETITYIYNKKPHCYNTIHATTSRSTAALKQGTSPAIFFLKWNTIKTKIIFFDKTENKNGIYFSKLKYHCNSL